jgi:hypothetical protein
MHLPFPNHSLGRKPIYSTETEHLTNQRIQQLNVALSEHIHDCLRRGMFVAQMCSFWLGGNSRRYSIPWKLVEEKVAFLQTGLIGFEGIERIAGSNLWGVLPMGSVEAETERIRREVMHVVTCRACSAWDGKLSDSAIPK